MILQIHSSFAYGLHISMNTKVAVLLSSLYFLLGTAEKESYLGPVRNMVYLCRSMEQRPFLGKKLTMWSCAPTNLCWHRDFSVLSAENLGRVDFESRCKCLHKISEQTFLRYFELVYNSQSRYVTF